VKLPMWSWFDNPFEGTRELNGLRVLMALVNNWDLLTDNNAIRDLQGVAGAYYVSDLGATFGRISGGMSPTRNDPEAYSGSEFIHDVTSTVVNFNTRTCAAAVPVMFVFPPHYRRCQNTKRVVEDIPLADAAWIAGWLSLLSPQQIVDAFRAAGYSPEDVTMLAAEVSKRVAKLNAIVGTRASLPK
jgi:hypothetical protein